MKWWYKAIIGYVAALAVLLLVLHFAGIGDINFNEDGTWTSHSVK